MCEASNSHQASNSHHSRHFEQDCINTDGCYLVRRYKEQLVYTTIGLSCSRLSNIKSKFTNSNQKRRNAMQSNSIFLFFPSISFLWHSTILRYLYLLLYRVLSCWSSHSICCHDYSILFEISFFYCCFRRLILHYIIMFDMFHLW